MNKIVVKGVMPLVDREGEMESIPIDFSKVNPLNTNLFKL